MTDPLDHLAGTHTDRTLHVLPPTDEPSTAVLQRGTGP